MLTLINYAVRSVKLNKNEKEYCLNWFFNQKDTLYNLCGLWRLSRTLTSTKQLNYVLISTLVWKLVIRVSTTPQHCMRQPTKKYSSWSCVWRPIISELTKSRLIHYILLWRSYQSWNLTQNLWILKVDALHKNAKHHY
jgi:hypothetical protein